jgi:hypothetical protein
VILDVVRDGLGQLRHGWRLSRSDLRFLLGRTGSSYLADCSRLIRR